MADRAPVCFPRGKRKGPPPSASSSAAARSGEGPPSKKRGGAAASSAAGTEQDFLFGTDRVAEFMDKGFTFISVVRPRLWLRCWLCWHSIC